MNESILKMRQSNDFQFQNEAAFDEVFQQANFNTFVFRSRVKLETYNVSNAGMVISLIKCLRLCWHHSMLCIRTILYLCERQRERKGCSLNSLNHNYSFTRWKCLTQTGSSCVFPF